MANYSARLFRPLDAPSAFPILDIHVHIGPSDTGEIFYPHLTGAEYLMHMQGSNIGRACVFAPYRIDGYRRANRELLAWARTTEQRILPFARLGGAERPITVRESWMIRRKIAGWLTRRPADIDSLETLEEFAGIKLLPQLDGLPKDSTFDRIAELGLPVLVHGGTHCPPEFIERRILPRVSGPLIVAHCGSFPADDRAFFDAVSLARRRENVYLDTSGVPVSEFLRHAVERIPEKLVFGSDAPLSHPIIAWHHLASVVASDHTLELVGRINAERLLAH